VKCLSDPAPFISPKLKNGIDFTEETSLKITRLRNVCETHKLWASGCLPAFFEGGFFYRFRSPKEWVNGTEASFAEQTWTALVTFTYGTNVISVSARDQAGNVSSGDREVYYRPGLATFMEYFYDDNGCLIEKIANDDTVNTYEYTPENRLVKATLTDNSTCEYTYDGDLRQVARKKPDGTETWFLHDGVNILMDQATDGTPWAYYNQGIGIDKMISVVEWAGQTDPQKRYYHADAIGSVRSMTDDDGSQVQTYSYDAWGNITASSGTEANEYKFTSRRWEAELGLQYNRARFYDPGIGRFITLDPLTGGPDDPTILYLAGVYSAFHRILKEHVDALQPHKLNRYVYCTNNPVNIIDPLGLNMYIDGEKEDGLEKMMEDSGLPLVINDENNVERAEGPRDANGTSETLANNIIAAIEDPTVDVKIYFGYNLMAIFGGYNKERESHDIDLYDLNKYEELTSKGYGIAALTHEIAEAYGEAKNPELRENRWVHNYYAIYEQNACLQEYGIDDSRLNSITKCYEYKTPKRTGTTVWFVEFKKSIVMMKVDYDLNESSNDLSEVNIMEKK